ncbi:hypothetical protein LTR37_007574 [Vermiconidia calcicola]|uniref:Uncharacterized protein n=1 Tax=Vermiconidia calcicola TaxID=1690605 RepID=A0ACC3NDL3_9PEZI|nr:hypothetical protein LTR37_007574 [Vermiconidia calcicola]
MAYLPTDNQGLVNFIKKERATAVQRLAQQSRKNGAVPDESSESNKLLYERLAKLLTALDEEVTMTPDIKSSTSIHVGLKVIFDMPEFHFPKAYSEKAKALYEKWEEQNWGAEPVPLKDERTVTPELSDAAVNGQRPVKRQRTTPPANTSRKDSTTAVIDNEAKVRYPPPDHTIWGVDGIMHGLALKKGHSGKRSYILDTRYQKGDSNVYGDNGIDVGTWFPFQMTALFNGAHGSTTAGIAGSRDTGAYSIVVAGQYDDLDSDHGDYLYYSGSRSHDNTDPRQSAPSSGGTLALHASLRTGNPVRVLRSASGKSRYAPFYGLRYDGLYRVVSLQEPMNGKGGRYEQFRLERLDDQTSIDELRRTRPSQRERRDYEKIGEWSSRS